METNPIRSLKEIKVNILVPVSLEKCTSEEQFSVVETYLIVPGYTFFILLKLLHYYGDNVHSFYISLRPKMVR